ncbi:hypothetical protein LEMLEM_LOCUS13916 [Lemmus lemmus]
MIEPHTHAAVQVTGACSAAGQGAVRRCGYPGPCEGWWSCGPNLCYTTVHLQSPGGLLPKVCG